MSSVSNKYLLSLSLTDLEMSVPYFHIRGALSQIHLILTACNFLSKKSCRRKKAYNLSNEKSCRRKKPRTSGTEKAVTLAVKQLTILRGKSCWRNKTQTKRVVGAKKLTTSSTKKVVGGERHIERTKL